MKTHFGSHVPDILDCLAQLSNSAVPTPPKLAKAMLDILPDEVWSRPDYVWLDPFSKSGVFLREVATRLFDGLADWEPDFINRREHIFRHMLFGAAITEMTGIVSRRSIYCSADASGPHSVVRFDDPQGNLPFLPAEHDFDGKGKCRLCGAPQELERGDSRENYAYAFTHGAYPTMEMANMKFDVIVGNPPYQVGVEGNSRTRPVYHQFVDQAMRLNPKYVVMITPSRWFAGGLGLDDFRRNMLSAPHFRTLVDYPNAADCFPGVEIKGGVSYFLWDSNHSGPTEITTRRRGKPDSVATRDLDAYDVLVRSNEAISILEKVLAFAEPTLDETVSAQKPFGLQSNYHGSSVPSGARTIALYGTKRITYVAEDEITMNQSWIPFHKVLVSEGYNGGEALPHRITGRPFAVSPGSACTQTYLVLGRFQTEYEAANLVKYMSTRFTRFLISLRKITQHCKPDTFSFVPSLPMEREWTDDELYLKYGITDHEAAFIESQIKAMPATATDEPEDDE